MDATRQPLKLSWGEVSYLDWRPVARPVSSTLLLLHGGGLDNAALSWGGLGQALADVGHRVVAPDHPGYGQSPLAPWPATQRRLVAYVGEVVDALGLDRYAVGGLSLGGGMAIGHTLARPQRVTGAILLGSYGLMDHQYDGWYARPAHLLTWLTLRTGMLSALTRLCGRNRRLMDSSVRTIIRSPEHRTPELLDQIMAAAQREDAFAAFEQWQRDQFGWHRLKTNYFDRLRNFPCPALVIHGDHDTGVPVARARAAARQLPDARLLVVPDAGHWVQRDRPDIVLPAMLHFLDNLQ